MKRTGALAMLLLPCGGCSVVGGTLGGVGALMDVLISVALIVAPFGVTYYFYRRR